MRHAAYLMAASLVLVLLVGPPAQAADRTVIADWEMNEPAGARAMVDDTGTAPSGVVGSEVVTGVWPTPGTTAYRFTRLKPNTPPARPAHNVLVPHDARLNPAGRAEYVVEVRFRTTNSFGNLVQKGQAGAKGGYWKVQLPQAEPSCLFRGPAGVTNSVRARGKRVDDNLWHTVRCEATPTEVRLYLDGVFVGSNRGTTGAIANTQVISVGGKYDCDQMSVTCDYFGGDVDYVRLEGTPVPR